MERKTLEIGLGDLGVVKGLKRVEDIGEHFLEF